MALKQSDEAEKNAQQARDIMPDNPPVYLLLANIHIQKKDYPSLIRDLDEYLRLAPNAPEAEQARKTRERVQNILNQTKADSADDDQDKIAGRCGGREHGHGRGEKLCPRQQPETGHSSFFTAAHQMRRDCGISRLSRPLRIKY